MKDRELWEKYLKENDEAGNTYESWQFGSDPDKLAELVVSGQKTATASAYALYEIENEPIPNIGQYNIILNSNDEAMCIIKTTKVYVVPFNQVTEEHAFKEGDGDKTLTYWRNGHKKFFSQCLAKAGMEFDEQMKVVCEEFEVVYSN